MWKIGNTKTILKTPIWNVESTEKTFNEKSGEFTSLAAPNWVKAVVYNATKDKWIMVHEFRHGVNQKVYEFPSGTVEPGEMALDAAIRELTEETGYDKSQLLRMECVFEGNPNPAFMNNHMSCFLFVVTGEPLSPRNLDKFEDIDVVEVTNPADYLDFRNGAIADQFALLTARQALTRDHSNVLVVVDAQNDFIDGSLPVGLDKWLKAKECLIRLVSDHNYKTIVFTLDAHPSDHCSFNAQNGPWPSHCVKGTNGYELYNGLVDEIKALQPDAEIIFVEKGKDKNLEEYGIDIFDHVALSNSNRVDFTGLCFDYCVANCARLTSTNHDVLCRVIKSATVAIDPTASPDFGRAVVIE